MDNLDRIRFVAANYSSLQGLKQVPFGVLAVLVSVWANTLHRPATDLTWPVLVAAACAGLYLLIDRYYARVFGHGRRAPSTVRLEWVIQIGGAVLALIAFAVDVSLKWPVSTLGLVFAAVLLADYLRITRLARDRFLLYYPAMALVMIGLSFLPLIGPGNWWRAIGISSPVLAVLMVFGLLVILFGILVHLFLVRSLPPVQETQNG